MNTENAATGKLVARVTSGRGIIPIEGATVYVREYGDGTEGELLYTLKTDAGGLTETVVLATPDKSSSLSPASSSLPYSEYVTTTVKSGFYTVENIGVPVFDGVTSVQAVDLVPLTETDRINGNGGNTVYYENAGYSNLNGNLSEQT